MPGSTLDREEDGSSCKSSVPPFCREVSTLAETVVLPGWADKNKGSCCIFLYLLSKPFFFFLCYNSVKARSFPHNCCVSLIGQMEKQGACADILLSWN